MCKLNKQDKNIGSNNFEQEQYAVISNEFITCSTTAQNVITINLVISFGVIAAIISILTSTSNDILDGNYLENILCSALSAIGLIGTVSCIRTINFQENRIMKLQKMMYDIEVKNSGVIYHEMERYKPLHITRMGFCIFYAIFFLITIWQLGEVEMVLAGVNRVLKYAIYSASIIVLNILLVIISNCIFNITNKMNKKGK